jgi:hypothetical protein
VFIQNCYFGLHEYTDELIPFFCHRAKPGPVRRLDAHANFRGSLFLQWRPPRGSRVLYYRLERSRDGHAYEPVAEITGEWFCLNDAPRGEPWFYRVVAVNVRGAGREKCVWFFQRAGNGKSRLEFVPVLPGLCLNIFV